jgi:outer membrane protein insertion porin family
LRPSCRILLAVAILSALAPHAFAQDEDEEEPAAEQDQERLEGLTIDRIDIEAPPREDAGRLLVASGLVSGNPYQAEQIRRAVKILYQLGRFENVIVLARRAGNLVEVRLVLQPRPSVREVTVIGSGEVSSSILEQAVGIKVGDELVTSSLGDRRAAIAKALERLGYRSPAIGVAVQSVDENGGVEVLLRVDEGPKTRLRNTVIRGRPRRPLWRVLERLGVGTGDVIDLERIEAGLERIEQDYRDEGFFEVRIAPPEIRELGDTRDRAPLADLVLDIQSGPKTSVRFNGQRVVPKGELDEAVSVLRDLGATKAALSEAKERVLARYERRGYWRVKVEPAVRETPDGSEQEVLFSIDEGEPARVDEIEFPGNVALEEDLLRETMIQVIEQTLGAELAKPSTDPGVVSAIVDPGSVKRTHPAPQPYPADPDPRRLYIERAYRAGADAIADLYRAAGYQTVEVAAPQVVVSQDRRTLRILVAIQPGVQWRIGSIAFGGNEVLTSQELLDIAGLEPGQSLSFDRVEASRRAILAHYRNEGHLYARIDEELREVSTRGALGRAGFVKSSVDAPLDVRQVCGRAEAAGGTTCDVELAFRIREGPEVRARELIIRGSDSTRRSLVLGELKIAEGEILRESDLAETQRNLLRLGVFQRVTVRPMDEEAEAASKDVLIELRDAKHSSFEVGAGASTEEGVRVFAGYGHNNLLGSALRFQANAKINVQPFLLLYNETIRESLERFYADRPIEYLAAIGFSYPRILGLPRGYSAGLDLAVVRDNDPTFSEDTRLLTLTADYEGLRPVILGAPRPITFQLRGSFDWADLKCNPDLAERGRALCGASSDDPARRLEGTTIYTGFRPSLSWDLRDDPFNPRQGLYLEMQPEILFGLNDESPNHVNFRTKLNGYIPLFPSWSFAVSFVTWRIFPLEAKAVPVNRRFFAGGRSTIRGYPEQTLFPRDVNVVRVSEAIPGAAPGEAALSLSPGGLLMVALKSEIRFPISSGLDGTVFYDIGDLFVVPSNFTLGSGSRQGIGFGLRYATPIGPLLLDIAFPLVRRQPGELSWVPHFAAVGSF